MKWFTSLAAIAAWSSMVLAEDLLFLDTLQGLEVSEAESLGFTTKVISETQWRAMKTSDFAAFKAIIIGDNFGSSDLSLIQVLEDTKDVWGPAVQGNIIIQGADQSNHGKTVLIDNSIKFAASGKSPQGSQQTGLYFALSQYYDTTPVSQVPALSYFGTFEVRGDLDCYDAVHIVASSPAIDTLTDAYLSDWGCSVHEAFSAYPSVGVNGFQAIAIADGVVTTGTQSYADGHSGLPYIITRGATPAGCGDGHWDPGFGEECDDGNIVDGDGCSKSCKCESGLPKGDGTCYAANSTSIRPSSKPTGYVNSTASVGPSKTGGSTAPGGSYVPSVQPPYPISTYTPPPPYITPSLPSVTCIGVEVIVSVTVTEICSTIAPGTTVTSTSTHTCSTYQKPIYNTPIPSMPCYVCALSSEGITTKSGFITATTTHCPNCPTAAPATVYPCSTCSGTTLTATCPWQTTPAWESQGAAPYTTYAPQTTHTHCTSCTPVGGPAVTSSIRTVATGTGVPPKPTSTVSIFTGAAAKMTGTPIGLGAIAGFGMLLGLAI